MAMPGSLHVKGPSTSTFLSGAEIREPVVVDGPFIMNDRSQIDAVAARYRAGAMGALAALLDEWPFTTRKGDEPHASEPRRLSVRFPSDSGCLSQKSIEAIPKRNRHGSSPGSIIRKR